MAADTTEQAAWRWRVYPMVVLVTLGLSILLAVLRFDPGDPQNRLGGDYPAFYAAGSIAADGDWSELYTQERQQAEQAGLIDDDGGYLYFSYPPFVAGAYGLIATVGYQWSFLIHTLLMAGVLLGAIWALRPWLDRVEIPTPGLVAIAIAFYPVLRSIGGGQNTTLSLFLLAVTARLDSDERPWAAGLVAACLLFKPQFGVIVVPLLILTRRWRMLAGFGVGAVLLYVVSLGLMGQRWLGDWWSQASAFRDLNTDANGSNFISFPGFLENALGSGSDVALMIGYGLAAVFAVGVALVWWRYQDRASLARWSLVAAAAVVVAPQTLYYDAGLLLLPLVLAVGLVHSAGRWVVLAAGLTWLQIGSASLDWSPLGPLAIAAAVALLGWQLQLVVPARRLG